MTCGDDAVAPKANTSNLLIQDSHFHDTIGVAIGSIGQYPGVYEFIENVTAERIICDGCAHAGYVKTWTGVEKGVPPNGAYPSQSVGCIGLRLTLQSRRRRRHRLREEHR